MCVLRVLAVKLRLLSCRLYVFRICGLILILKEESKILVSVFFCFGIKKQLFLKDFLQM